VIDNTVLQFRQSTAHQQQTCRFIAGDCHVLQKWRTRRIEHKHASVTRLTQIAFGDDAVSADQNRIQTVNAIPLILSHIAVLNLQREALSFMVHSVPTILLNVAPLQEDIAVNGTYSRIPPIRNDAICDGKIHVLAGDTSVTRSADGKAVKNGIIAHPNNGPVAFGGADLKVQNNE